MMFSLWSHMLQLRATAGFFFFAALFIGLAATVWVYMDSMKYWGDPVRAGILAALTATLLFFLFFTHPFYFFIVVTAVAIYIALGHKLPYAALNCPACGGKNTVVARRCGTCGTALRGLTQEKICQQCERDYRGSIAYCLYCGEKLVDYEPEVVGPRKDGGIMLCPHCGEKNMNWRPECWKCHKRLKGGNNSNADGADSN